MLGSANVEVSTLHMRQYMLNPWILVGGHLGEYQQTVVFREGSWHKNNL